MAKIIHPELLQGKTVNIREVSIDDAKFILDLRTSERAKFLHHTEYNIQAQIDYIKYYLTLDDEWYFIIEDKEHNPIGTDRIITKDKNTFETASTIMVPEATPIQVIEMTRLILLYAFCVLGFSKHYAYTMKTNEQINKLNLLQGMKIKREDDNFYYFETTIDDYKWIKKEKEKFLK